MIGRLRQVFRLFSKTFKPFLIAQFVPFHHVFLAVAGVARLRNFRSEGGLFPHQGERRGRCR
jgi:hypothetical protein